ncbi:MAG: hypothetical protein K8R54_08055 [Bacteroidales bacterium]|nr:hypothetical protein [Bacteroidales bacterium]
MRNKISLTNILFSALILIFAFSLSSCHKRIELEEDYADYRRVIGPEGGIINYYEYNPQDEISEVIVSLEIPENALDSFVVFNMYEFDDEAAYVDLYNIGMETNSEFLYFVPFYESYGYNEHTVNTKDYHLSIDFNIPVTVTYNLSFYYIGDSAKLWRIKIPKITEEVDDQGNFLNEWGQIDNVWVNWNYQGYPDGYDKLDLTYLVNGRWTESEYWGEGDLSLDNWEEVPGLIYDKTNETVTFDIDNTDYMYVMAVYWGL